MSQNLLTFNSRRTVVCVPHGAVACAQPLAAEMGLSILKAGGNAADAAVACAAGMNLCQPDTTGIGGDVFLLYYDANTRTVKGLNGSGRAPAELTLQKALDDGFGPGNPFPREHGHTVTVPGTAAAWADCVQEYGSGNLSLLEVLQPAIDLAEGGFPVSMSTARAWKSSENLFKHPDNIFGGDMLIDGNSPKWGQIWRNPNLANTFRLLGTQGKAGFYEGPVAQAITEAVARFGGVMRVEDLAAHTSTLDEPIYTDYKGVRLWEIPPNGQGIVALMMLNLLEPYDLQGMGHNSTDYLHTLIEASRLSFADAFAYVADPTYPGVEVPVPGMLSREYADVRRALINPDTAMTDVEPGNPWDYNSSKDTIYLTVVDAQGNACSLINSKYQGFGTGIVPQNAGFTLQNRGLNFSLEEGHPNVLAPGKRSFHTIIPAMLTKTDTGEFLSSYGVMGGFMQPQGHVQVLLNMLEFGMHPQEALDAPRFQVSSNLQNVDIEDGISQSVIADLRAKGHNIRGPVTGNSRTTFGRGHCITRGAWWAKPDNEWIEDEDRALWAGTDPRADGIAVGY